MHKKGPEQLIVEDIIWRARLVGFDLFQFDSQAVKNKKGFWMKSIYVPEGCPDLLGHCNKYFVAVEVKTKENFILRRAQFEFLERIIIAGSFACVVTSFQDFMQMWHRRGETRFLLDELYKVPIKKEYPKSIKI